MAHTIACIKYNTSVIGGIQSSSFSSGLEQWLLSGSESIYATFAAVNRIAPVCRFTSILIDVLLDLAGVTGLKIDTYPLEFWTQGFVDGGTRATTGEKITVDKGILYPVRLTLADGEPATIEYQAMAGSAAGTVPVTLASAQTVPTTATISELFTLGAVTIDTDQAPVQRVEIDFGITCRQQFGSGSVYPTMVYVESIEPRITLTTNKVTAFVGHTLVGKPSTISITAAACTQGGVRTGTGDKVFTTSESFMFPGTVGGSSRMPAATDITVTPTHDGTNPIITIT